MNVAIILAGGKGTRFGTEHPKQFVEIHEKPLIVHALEKFSKNSNIDEICVVCLENYVSELEEIIKKYDIKKISHIIIGGSTRHESIRNGVNFLRDNGYPNKTKVIIHNANMPLVTETNINECISLCDDDTIVTTAAKCHGFFYQIDDGELKIGPDRNDLMHAKVPEGMYLDVACRIYNSPKFEEKIYESYTAGMLGIILGLNIKVSICGSTNMKITTPEDYELVKIYLENEKRG